MEKLLVIGGNGAGLAAAARAKRIRPHMDVLVIEQSRYISYSICGAPYLISGMVPRVEDLVGFSPESLWRERGIQAIVGVRAIEIMPSMRRVTTLDTRTQARATLGFDKLIIATGYASNRSSIPGASAKNVFSLAQHEDTIRLQSALASGAYRQAVIIGAGYVGLEMAEALATRGLSVLVIEKEPTLLGGIDADISELIEAELGKHGVQVLKGAAARAIQAGKDGVAEAVVYGPTDTVAKADMVMLDIGVRPNVELAAACGVTLGRTGGIAVNDHLETNYAGIYAAGNCAEAKHLVSGKAVIDALGTVAAKQGRVAGENAAGWKTRFAGVVGTCVVKVFDLAVARVGLTSREAQSHGFKSIAAKITDKTISHYYPGGAPITIKIVVDTDSRRLLGAQMVGGSDVAKRTDVIATILTNHMRIDEAAQLDLSYTPPFAPLWDPILVAMHAGLRALEK
ncbi:MAG: FAD-dependent oxidoreductase [Acidobacteria bacterium]|nr:FAD-dependent oxidoreductase [Acidobacteriota bacterium]MBI3655777.1 FAD-dependent oxidoreductase [Acidobacteriota bacterium]